MSKVIFAIVTLCVIQFAAGRVVREAPTATTTDAWQDVVKSTRETVDTLHTALLKLTGVQSDEELINKVTTQAQTVGNSLQSQIAEITKEAQKNAGKFDGVYKQFTDKLSEVATDLKNRNPALNGDTAKLQESIEKGYREAAENAKELRAKLSAEQEVISGKTEELFTNVLTLISNSAKEISKTINEKAN